MVYERVRIPFALMGWFCYDCRRWIAGIDEYKQLERAWLDLPTLCCLTCKNAYTEACLECMQLGDFPCHECKWYVEYDDEEYEIHNPYEDMPWEFERTTHRGYCHLKRLRETIRAKIRNKRPTPLSWNRPLSDFM